MIFPSVQKYIFWLCQRSLGLLLELSMLDCFLKCNDFTKNFKLDFLSKVKVNSVESGKGNEERKFI